MIIYMHVLICTLYIYAYEYVCMYVCMFVCMHACIDVCMYVFRHSPYMVKQRVNPKKDVQKTSDGT